jgi:MinD-like ATPase involved in chromosome partitioning or flagellar assembly
LRGEAQRITFVPFFPDPDDERAAELLRTAADPRAPAPCLVAQMPITGVGFFEAVGATARQLDRIWAARVPEDSHPVVLLLDEPELPAYVGALDATFLVGADGGGDAYAHLPNVEVVPSTDPLEVTRAAMQRWSDLFLPGLIDDRRSLEALAHSSRDAAIETDAGLIDALFGNRDTSPSPRADAGRHADPPAPSPTSRPAVDPLRALAETRRHPAATAAAHGSGDELAATDEVPAPVDGSSDGNGAGPRGWLDRARTMVSRRRPLIVPDEIGDLLIGTRPTPVVVVGSRKGGVGKTALSAGLAQVCGYGLDGRAGVAALVDQNINNADQWGRLMVASEARTVRDIMAALESGDDFGPAPTFARTPALAVYPESRDPGDGYPAALVELFVHNLRSRHAISVIDLPNTLPAYTSAEAAVAAAYIDHSDLVLVPTTDDPNSLRGALDYLGVASMRDKPCIVPYIVSTERGIRDDPKVRGMLDAIRERGAAIVPFPKTEKATLAVVKGASILDVDARLRDAYVDLALATAKTLARGAA